MTVSFSPLVPIIFVRPLTSIERVKRNPVDRMPQILITGKAKIYDMTFATRFGYGDSSPLGLKVAKGLPAILGIAQLSPSLGIVVPLFPPSRLFTSSAAGVEAKKCSTSSL